MIIVLSVVTIITFVMTARSLLVVIGAYKDPLLASFEQYGEERFFSPPLVLIAWTTVLIYVSLYWYVDPRPLFASGFVLLIVGSMFHNAVFNLIEKNRYKLMQQPVWVHDLMQMTDREERRRIAYMWLALPPATRMLYNANNALFKQWVEQVLLTVAQ